VDRYGDAVPVPAFGPRMVCTHRGIIGAFAKPNWQERNRRSIGRTRGQRACLDDRPSWYLVATEDKMILPPAQRRDVSGYPNPHLAAFR